MKVVLKCQWCGLEAEMVLKHANGYVFELPSAVCAAPEHGPATMRVEGYRDEPKERKVG